MAFGDDLLGCEKWPFGRDCLCLRERVPAWDPGTNLLASAEMLQYARQIGKALAEVHDESVRIGMWC